ncbi:GcrA family cell cycle regulator [Sinorhizobium fredii]|uniref:GcrA family cell cycle regulator n=1 Tax=Rhizobium fredii TaxID=380 RepID=UPI0030AA841A
MPARSPFGGKAVMSHEAQIAAGLLPAAPRLVPLAEVSETQCRYPVLAAPNAPGKFLFCGLPTALGKTFCPFHHRLCWRGRDEPFDRAAAAARRLGHG